MKQFDVVDRKFAGFQFNIPGNGFIHINIHNMIIEKQIAFG